MSKITMNIRFCLSIILLSLFVLSCSSNLKNVLKKGRTIEKEFFVEMDFEYIHHLIILNAHINGQPARLILDTGAPNVITKEYFDRINPPVLSKHSLNDANSNRQSTKFVSLKTLSIPGFTVENSAATVIDLNAMQVFRCLEIDGILGANFLRHSYCQIDYSNRKLYLSSDKSKLPMQERPDEVIAFSPNSAGTPKTNIVYRNRKFSDVTLDTGSAGYFSLGGTPGKELRMQPIVSQYGTTSVGAFGRSQDTAFYLIADSIQLAGHIYTDQYLKIKKNSSNLVGNRIFENYIVTIDWSANIWTMNGKPEIKPEYKSLGISLGLEDGRLVVSSLVAGSHGEKAGLREGTEILSVNGMDVGLLSEEEYCDRFSIASDFSELEKIQLEFKDESGQIKSIDLIQETFLEKP